MRIREVVGMTGAHGAGERPRGLDIVVPLYNEERGVEAFHWQLALVASALLLDVTIYYVNDGSTDETAAALDAIAARDDRVVVIELSRNFGHQAALCAGLDAARGDAVVTMDGDGQHPPELLPDMIKLLEAGYDVVLAQRYDGRQSTVAKRWASGVFYWLLSRIGDTELEPGCADYRLVSRRVVDALKQMPEYHRFLRGMVAWLGYRSVILPYAEKPRIEGRSKYSVGKMMRLATDAVSSFSLVPLRIGIALGLGFLTIAMLEMAYVSWAWLRGERHLLVPGWSSLMFATLLLGGVMMVTMGVIGIYVGYIFQEVKRRPVYVIRDVRRRDADQAAPPHEA